MNTRTVRVYLVGLSVLAIAQFAATMIPARAAPPSVADDRQKLVQALLSAKVIDAERVLVHISHTCDLHIDGSTYPVLDVRELVKNASVPRGYNQIVILTSSFSVRQALRYTTERPLFCDGNKLYVFGTLMVRNEAPGGNVLVFSSNAEKFVAKNVDWLSLPRLKDRKD
jgi:hypothetical protein